MASCGDEVVSPRVPGMEISFDRGYGIFVTDTAGANEVSVLLSSDPSYDPTWSPDGRYVVYTRQSYHPYISFEYQLFRFDTGTGKETPLTSGMDDAFEAEWSPDGKKIAYLARPRGTGGNAALFVINPDGTGKVRIGSDLFWVWGLSWSPDGQSIAAMVEGHIVIVDIRAGRIVKQLTGGEGYYQEPAWSPNGTTIAVSWLSKIHLIDASTGAMRHLVDNGFAPAWSPDGKMIAYDYNSDVYLVDVASGRTKNLTNTPDTNTRESSERRPAWRHRP